MPVDFFFQAAFAAAAATIVSGAVAGRTRFSGYLVYSAVITALIYPIVVGWKWGGGWLDDLGFVDFAGSGLVHMTGGFAALAGAMIIGPRIGKYDERRRARALPGHSIPLAMTGVLLLFIGWFGFNPGSQLQADLAVPVIAVLTAFAGAAGGASAMVTSWLTMGKPDVSMAGNGLLAGLVAICSGVGELSPTGTLITGAVAGAIVVLSVLGIERIGIDDPVGAFSVHGVGGLWGLVATGLFATTSPVNGATESAGLLYGGGCRPAGRSADRRGRHRRVRVRSGRGHVPGPQDGRVATGRRRRGAGRTRRVRTRQPGLRLRGPARADRLTGPMSTQGVQPCS